MSEKRMNTEEIVTMCERLARKYKRNDVSEDLVSEALVAIYDRLDVKPDDYPASLYRVANKAMHDYINIKSKPVYIPKTRTAESMSKGIDYKGQTHSEKGKKILEEALNSTSVSAEDSYSLATQDCSAEYEDREFIVRAMSMLTERERELIHDLYFLEISQVSLSKLYGVTQQTISNWEAQAVQKMSNL